MSPPATRSVLVKEDPDFPTFSFVSQLWAFEIEFEVEVEVVVVVVAAVPSM